MLNETVALANSIEASPITELVVGTLLILVVGFLVGRFARSIAKQLLKGVGADKQAKKIGYTSPFSKQLANAISVLIYTATIIIALDHVGITKPVLLIVLGLLILIILISVLLAVKDALPNLIAGLSLLYRKPFREGDLITIRTITGTIKRIGLFNTKIHEGEDDIFVPNHLFIKEGYDSKQVKHRKK